jgi:leader peptidase (prepilin peptidase)/N-methyltransferase
MALVLAPVIGSFAGVVVRRYPGGEGIMTGRSHCDSCGAELSALELLPFVSFVCQGGRCRHCKARIGWFHPAIEFVALLVPAAALAAGLDGWWLWGLCGLGWTLLTAAWIDALHFVLPDAIVLPLLLSGLLTCWLRTPWAIYDHAAASAIGYGTFRALDAFYAAIRGHAGLGEGDAKLLAAAGAWAGLAALPVIVLAGGLLGLAVALPLALRTGQGGQTMIPFGPALAFASFAAMLGVG